MVNDQEEMKCPKCGAYMKEFACSYKCRNLNCRYTYETFFYAPANIQQQVQPDNAEKEIPFGYYPNNEFEE